MNVRDNKLIAEFMELEVVQENGYECIVYADNNTRTLADTAYHTSWDWLMPVVEKCLTTGDSNHYKLNDALLTCNIKEVYAQVVEFIKAQKK